MNDNHSINQMETTTPLFRTITVIFIFNETSSDPSKHGSTGDWLSVIGLILLALPTFAFNALLVGTIASSSALKRIPFYLILLSLGSIHLIDSTLNLAMSLAFAAQKRSWPLSGRNGCAFNAFSRLFVVVLISVQLSHLLVDRVVAVRKTICYKQQVTCNRQCIAILLLWIISFIYAVPTSLPDVVCTRPFSSRYSCDLVREDSQSLYIIWLANLAFVLPLIITCVCILYLLLVVYKDSRASRSSVHALSDNVLKQPLLWSQLQLTHVALAIFTSYILLQLPAIVNSIVDALTVTHAYNKIPIKNNNGTTDVNNKVNGTSYLVLREVFNSPPRDVAFAWFRYLDSLIYPLIAFALRKDIRNKARVLFTFWKPHSNADLSPRRTSYISAIREVKTLKTSKRKKTRDKLAHYATPVLFATSEGLYLRVTQDSARRAQSGGIRFWLESGMISKKPQFVCHICDVWDAFDDIEDLENEGKETESRPNSLLERRSPSQVNAAPSTSSDGDDSGVGDPDSDDDLPRSAKRTRSVWFEESTVQQAAESGPSEVRLPVRPSTVARLPPISETAAEVNNDPNQCKGLFLKNTKMKCNKRGSTKHQKKAEWNTSTKPGEGWLVIPTRNGRSKSYRL